MNDVLPEDELNMIRSVVFISVAIKAMEWDRLHISEWGVKIPSPYCSFIDRVQGMLYKQLHEHRRIIRQLGIKIYETKEGKMIHVEAFKEGYRHEMSFPGWLIKAEIEQGLFKVLSSGTVCTPLFPSDIPR